MDKFLHPLYPLWWFLHAAQCLSALLPLWCPERSSQHPPLHPILERAALLCHRGSLRWVFHLVASPSQRTIPSVFPQMLQQFLIFSPSFSFFFFIIIFIELPFLNMALKRRNKKATKNVPGQKEASKSCLPQL